MKNERARGAKWEAGKEERGDAFSGEIEAKGPDKQELRHDGIARLEEEYGRNPELAAVFEKAGETANPLHRIEEMLDMLNKMSLDIEKSVRPGPAKKERLDFISQLKTELRELI